MLYKLLLRLTTKELRKSNYRFNACKIKDTCNGENKSLVRLQIQLSSNSSGVGVRWQRGACDMTEPSVVLIYQVKEGKKC